MINDKVLFSYLYSSRIMNFFYASLYASLAQSLAWQQNTIEAHSCSNISAIGMVDVVAFCKNFMT